MPDVIDIRRAEDPRDVIHRACQVLAEGGLVILPTETQYNVVGSALNAEAVATLKNLRSAEFDLVVKCGDEARDYWTPVTGFAEKLSRRCWPGPVVLSFDPATVDGLFGRLPATTQDVLSNCPSGIRFRVPASPVWQEIQRLTPGPLMASADDPANTAARREVVSLVESFGASARLVIDDGPCRYGENATVVRVFPNRWDLVTPGVVSSRNIGRLASEVYLFVCTGNTCRSPMAEAIFRKRLATCLECRDDELVDRGFMVASAGLAASVGSPASPEAVELLAGDHIDLREHESQPLTERLLNQADYIFTMTRGHRSAILAERPDLAHRVRLLSSEGNDISDPIGSGPAAYAACRDEIEKHLQRIVEPIVAGMKSSS